MAWAHYLVRLCVTAFIKYQSWFAVSEQSTFSFLAYWGLGFTEIERHSLLSLTFFSCGSCFAYGRLVGLLWMGRSKVTFRFEKRTVLMEKISGL